MLKLKDPVFLIRRSSFDIQTPLKFLEKYHNDYSLLKKYNKLVNYKVIKEEIDEHSKVVYTTVKCPFPFSNRDYLDYEIVKVKGDKIITIITMAPDLIYP